MEHHIRIRKAPGTFVVRSDGAVLGESRAALELTEGNRNPVIYFPREDIAMALLDRSPTTSTCPHKGEASYFTLVTGNGQVRDVAWSYETPKAAVAEIAGYLAFYPEKVTVERL